MPEGNTTTAPAGEMPTSPTDGATVTSETQVTENAGAAAPKTTPSATTTPTLDQITKDYADAQARIKHLNSESAGHRKTANELKAQLEAIQAERDKALGELDQVRSEYRAARINTALTLAIQAAGFNKPVAQGLKLIDLAAIDVANDGTVKGVDEAIKAMQKDWPELFKQATAPSTDAGQRGKADKTYGGKTLDAIAKKYNIGSG